MKKKKNPILPSFNSDYTSQGMERIREEEEELREGAEEKRKIEEEEKRVELREQLDIEIRELHYPRGRYCIVVKSVYSVWLTV